MAERSIVRAFSLPYDVSQRLDKAVILMVTDVALARQLGLIPQPVQTEKADERGMTPADYKALQELLGVSKLQGDDLILRGFQDPIKSKVARRLVIDAQRRNRIKPVPLRNGVNASRLVAALLLKGLEKLEVEARGTESGGRTRRNAKQAA